MGEKGRPVEAIILDDPLSGEEVGAFLVCGEDGLELITIPDRALDIYRLRYRGIDISYTDDRAGISHRNFVEQGTEGFLRNFFAGLLTTCGLCNAGRPCQEGGHSFGLHGCISNIPCTDVAVREEDGKVSIRGTADEVHEEVHMRLCREITADLSSQQLSIEDIVENLSPSPQPYMMMYHINFGAPFLSEKLVVEGKFSYIENRDSGSMEEKEQLIHMGTPGSGERETVYYTKADMKEGITLYDPEKKIRAVLRAEGDGLDWMGVWKSFCLKPYAIGIEPCICPGLGRAGARERGLLVMLMPGERRKNRISLKLDQL